MMATKHLTDKQIQEQINALEEENTNTRRLSTRRGYGWGGGVMEKRRDKIDHLLSILAMRRLEKKQTTPKTTQPKKQGLIRTWDSKTKRWVYKYTKRTKKAKPPEKKSTPKPLEALFKEARKHKTATAFKKWWQTQAEDPFSYWRNARISKALSDAKLVKGGFPDYKVIFELAKKQPDTKLSQREKWLLEGKYKVRNKPKEVRKLGKAVASGLKIPTGMTLQKSLTKTGGQMHFKNGGGKKKPKTLSTKKTKRRVKKGSDNLMTFGMKLPDVRTLGDMLK